MDKLKKILTRRSVQIVLFLGAIVFALDTYSLFGESRYELDMTSGRTRYRTTVLGIIISENVKETPFSLAVARHGLSTGTPDYRFAGAHSFGGRFSCSKYGGVKADLDGLMLVFKTHPEFQDLERDIVAKTLECLSHADERKIKNFGYALFDAESKEEAVAIIDAQ